MALAPLSRWYLVAQWRDLTASYRLSTASLRGRSNGARNVQCLEEVAETVRCICNGGCAGGPAMAGPLPCNGGAGREGPSCNGGWADRLLQWRRTFSQPRLSLKRAARVAATAVTKHFGIGR